MSESRLPEATAKRILDRAIEIDGQRSTLMSIESLRSIAREMGVSDESLDEAIRESTSREHALPSRQAAIEPRQSSRRGSTSV